MINICSKASILTFHVKVVLPVEGLHNLFQRWAIVTVVWKHAAFKYHNDLKTS